MKPAEFEEKEYEGVLYSQLENGRANVWSPGQVLEQHLGFDRAMFINSPRIWRTIGRAMPPGDFFNRYRWEYVWRRRRRRPMPDFQLNLFIQAKRSMWFWQVPRHIKAVRFSGPCWCFDVEPHQQQALERVADRLGDRAAVLYAAPAFNTVLQLFAHTRNGTVVENSTFPDFGQLRGHSRWFYNRPGGSGVANPEPEISIGLSLDERIEKLRLGAEKKGDQGFVSNLAAFSAQVLSTLQVSALQDNPRVALYFEHLRAIEQELTGIQGERLHGPIKSYLQIAVFARSFNLEWFTVA